MNKAYATDVTDEQWALIEPLIPPAKHGGAPRTINMRLVFNTILYVNKTGCQWALIPNDLAKRSSAFDYFSAWKKDGTWQHIRDTLRRKIRTAAGREAEPSKAAIDSPAGTGSEAGGPRGYDGGKKVNGRKRHLIADSLALLLVVRETAANRDDGTHAPKVLARLTAAHSSRRDEIRGDGKCNNRTPDRYLLTSGAKYKMTVVDRPPGVTGLVLLPYRWVVERANAWTGKYRRNSKDDERTTAMSEAMVQATAIRLMRRRLAPDATAKRAEFKYPRKPLQKAEKVSG